MSNLLPSPCAKPLPHSRRLRFASSVAAVLSLLGGFHVSGQSRAPGEFPSTTQDRLNDQYWWPTKSTPPFSAFAGENACIACHAKQAASQATTPMAEAAVRLRGLSEPQKSKSETLQNGTYLYRTASDHLRFSLTVSSGKQSMTAAIAWIVGAGVHGQTYILESNGTFYESQVSSFTALRGMDLTPGHAMAEPGNLKNALGERLTTYATARCLACHATYSSTNSKLDLSHVVPGVHCEGCHGPGLRHVYAEHVQHDQDDASNTILNPAHLSAVDSVDFCGACHRTSMDVSESEDSYGPVNVRFQPYRLEKSRCWGTQGDDRLTCIACHNPHEPLVRDAAFYDQRCLNCHAPRGNESPSLGGGSAHSVCPKATANCTVCHMPKSEVPGMHSTFTDHYIRIVRAGESYPN
jgi:Cytochrome c3